MDEPESLGAIGLAAREKLDNLVFVINCNLQRLDGPVRGNGKIIQELEGEFRGAGWNVIKLIWGSNWDPLLARDKDGALRKIMEGHARRRLPGLQGERRRLSCARTSSAATRETLEMVAKMSDADVWALRRGGHDPHKVYAAFHAANEVHRASRRCMLVKTVKGYGMGGAGEGKNTAHQRRSWTTTILKRFRDRFNIPISDDDLPKLPFYKPADDTPEMKYLHERRKALGGYLPSAREGATSELQDAAARHLQGGARADR